MSEAREHADDGRALHVVVGVIERRDGLRLMERRPADGRGTRCWAHPGGKVEPAEHERRALERELHEELGIALTRAVHIGRCRVREEGRDIALSVFLCTAWRGRPRARTGQDLAWVAREHTCDLPRLPGVDPVERLLDAHRSHAPG